MRSSDSKFVQVFWILLVTVHVAQSTIYLDCDNISACDSVSSFVCALDKENVCFRAFNSDCEMRSTICRDTKDYLVFDSEFCDLVGFMCPKEFKEYNQAYARNEDLDQVIYSIYDKKTN